MSDEVLSLLSLIKTVAVRKSESGFTLASGRRSNLYVDLRRVTQDPNGINLIGRIVLSKIREVAPGAECVGGLETGSIPIATAVALLSAGDSPRQLSAFWVRKKPKDHGMENLIEGNLKPGAIIVDDTVTTGGSSLQAAQAVRAAGSKVLQAIAIVDRGAAQAFEDEKIPYFYFYGEADLLD